MMLNSQIPDLSSDGHLHEAPMSPPFLQKAPISSQGDCSSNYFAQTLNGSFDLAKTAVLERRIPSEREASVFESDPEGTAAVQFRLMQGRLTSRYNKGGALLITSPAANDGKSLTVHNLSWALAEAGHSTLLLELDLRKPTQATRLGAISAPDISNVLCGKEVPAEAVRQVKGLPLGFLGAGGPAKDVVAMLRSEALHNLLSWARSNFSWVIIDAPPVLPVADVDELLPNIDLVALVVRQRVTSRQLVQRAVERLGNRLDFTILNDIRFLASDGYYSS